MTMHLVLNYRSSQPHGWQADPDQSVGMTIGGMAQPGRSSPVVDNGGRANPFCPFGGHVSIYGNRVFNVNCGAVQPAAPMRGNDIALPGQFRAEIFLAQDAGMRDATGKGVVNIFGGISYGWRIAEVRR